MPSASVDVARAADVDGRQVDEAQERLVRVGAVDERPVDPAGDRPELAVRRRVEVQGRAGRRLVGHDAVEDEEPVRRARLLRLGQRVRVAVLADGVELQAGRRASAFSR